MGRIVRTAFSWALVGGFVTATMGLVAVMLNSDTGHVSRYAVPAMLGIPGFVVGLFIGAAFSSVATAVHEYYQTHLGERMFVGAVIGGVAGQVIVWTLWQDQLATVTAVIIGAWVAALLEGIRTNSTKPSPERETEREENRDSLSK